MGRPSHHGRDINGILLLDKPAKISSNNVLQKVKRIFAANHVGHTGALDPMATGMLPICFGEATKFSQFLLNSNKRYHVIAHLGQRTNTSDTEGFVIAERKPIFTQIQLEKALQHFLGDSLQIPSMYSALKYHGKPLYQYARQGINIKRKARTITVFDLQLIRRNEFSLELEIYCSKGTYIRTIIDDLGELLGCGAHVSQLRRLQVATYPYEHMITLEQLNILIKLKKIESTQTKLARQNSLYQTLDALLLPMESAVLNFPEVNLSPIAATYIKQGQPVQVSTALSTSIVRITEGAEHYFIGIGIINNNYVVPKRLIVERKN
ncbi:tRNA pseudouridine(55) synthase TruB [Candidatus Fukatsuia anoeciicola]|uniref:tRNA pseudouridine(55) synthase TruB n=1 Tax=Candidatus Fukatsuia anoeciicola TaxID=2994492 RepID=UPI003464202F